MGPRPACLLVDCVNWYPSWEKKAIVNFGFYPHLLKHFPIDKLSPLFKVSSGFYSNPVTIHHNWDFFTSL
jgi:hypothetical protein